MSIKPPINCPPDYSILVFRMTECKKAGVVKGVDTLASTDLRDLYVPIQEHTEGTLLLEGNTKKKINIDDISIKYPMLETYQFYVDLNTYPDALISGTSHTYSLYSEDLTLVEQISFTIDSNVPSYKDFPTALNTSVLASSQIKKLVGFSASSSLTTGTFTVSAATSGIKYRHVFGFDTDGFGGLPGAPYEHPGNLITPSVKYPLGRIKYLLLYPQYDKVDTSKCGCADASGDIRSNKKYFQYTNENNYENVNNTKTPILIQAASIGSTELTWTQESTSHIGYYIKVGDLISTVESPLYRGIVTAIDGYTITVDQPATSDLNAANQQLSHTYSPATPDWKNVGDMLFLSGATDVDDTDRCYIETIILNNPHSFNIPVKYMIGR